MKRLLMKSSMAGLLCTPLLLASPAGGHIVRVPAKMLCPVTPEFQATQAKQSSETPTAAPKQEEAANRAKRLKDYMANGNNAMQDARTIREQLQTATGTQRSVLRDRMQADYQTAITEYQEALKYTRLTEGDAIQPFGLIRLLRNGLVSEEKAIDMTAQDKNVPIIMSNLGMAYSGAGDYADAIPLLQMATVTKPEPTTYMQLGTDLAEVGKPREANAACEKVATGDPATVELKSACYRNIAVVLVNQGKLADAVSPLREATEVNANDALAWKLLGDALSNGITTREEQGKVVYVIPSGTVEAYQKYLQLEPSGVYATQVKATLSGFEQLAKGTATSAGAGKMP